MTNGSQGPDDGKVRYPKTAAKIRAALGAADLSQTDVSRRIGVQQANLSKIYGGLQAPSLTTLVELMDLLGVGLDDLIDRKEVKLVGVKVRNTKSASARKSQNSPRKK